jgi:hypothetical protein
MRARPRLDRRRPDIRGEEAQLMSADEIIRRLRLLCNDPNNRASVRGRRKTPLSG